MLVAATAFAIQYLLYQPHGPILALAVTAPLVPVIDYLLRGTNYRWTRIATAHETEGARS